MMAGGGAALRCELRAESREQRPSPVSPLGSRNQKKKKYKRLVDLINSSVHVCDGGRRGEGKKNGKKLVRVCVCACVLVRAHLSRR